MTATNPNAATGAQPQPPAPAGASIANTGAPSAALAAPPALGQTGASNYGAATELVIAQVLRACEAYGNRAIVALSGVPGTGKSFMGSIAAQRFANEPLLVREVQFHQGFSYEQFVEGMRIDSAGGTHPHPGIFLEWNQLAIDDPDKRYVLLIEELTRANVSAVLGELMTYVEHRERPFLTIYSRRPVRVAENLTILATFNPTNRSAINIDAALLRRLRIIQCPPSTEQLAEMLTEPDRNLSAEAIVKLQELFVACERARGLDYKMMPFGHGIFADVRQERPDLYELWHERIIHILRPPLIEPNMFTDIIERNYPWKDQNYETPTAQTTP